MANVTTIYACTEAGLAITNKPGTLPEWLPPRIVHQGQPVTAVWADPGPPARIVAVAGDRLMRSESGGRNWEPVGITEPVTSLLAVGEEQTLFAAGEGGQLWRSRDTGATWDERPQLPQDVKARLLAADLNQEGHFFVADLQNRKSVYAGDPERGEWKLLSLLQDVTTIAQGPQSGQLYAALDGGVMASEDDGLSWLWKPDAPEGGLAMLFLPAPANKPPTLLLGTPDGLYTSSDDGEEWHKVDLPQPGGVTSLARDPERRDRIYAATNTGYIFESGNRGAAWKAVNANPLPPITFLFIVRL